MANARSEPAGVRSRGGFTALEALLAAAILAFLTAAVSAALLAGRAQSHLARDTLNASILGQSLMNEIARLPITDPQGYNNGPSSTETARSLYDNVGDYTGYTDGPGNVPDGNGVVHPITDLAGNAYPAEYQPLARSVTLTSVQASPTGWNRTLNGIQITVTVSRDGLQLVTLQRIVWN